MFYIKNNLILIGKDDRGETEVTIYDIQNKYIGYSMKYPKYNNINYIEKIYIMLLKNGVLYF